MATMAMMVIVAAARFAGLVSASGTNTVADFKVFHLVGRMVWAGQIEQAYHAATMMPLERTLSGTDIFLPWTYPPLFNIIVAPFGPMPLWLAYLAFVGTTLALYLLVLRRIAGPYLSLSLVAIFPAICITANCGQNGFLTGSLVGLACLGLLRRDERSATSGIPLGLMMIKPHLAACLALHVLASQRWRVAAIAVGVILAGAAISTLAFGPSIWTAFLNGVAESRIFLERGLYPLHRMISAYAVTRTLGASAALAMAIQAGVAMLALAAVWMALRHAASRRQAVGIAVLTTLLISPYAYDYDLPIYGIGLALVLPDVLRLSTGAERIALLCLSWLASGWGMAMSVIVDRQYGETGMPPDLMPLSLGGAALLLLTALIWRILRRDWSPERGTFGPARRTGRGMKAGAPAIPVASERGAEAARAGLPLAAAFILSALVSTILNIAAQEAVRRLGPPEAIALPMLSGTLVGFVAKYGLDKRLVFSDAYRGAASEACKIVTYALFSVGTTLVFWGTELAFWWVWQTPQARYAGAVLGLTIGYTARFLLDRAFVFRDARA